MRQHKMLIAKKLIVSCSNLEIGCDCSHNSNFDFSAYEFENGLILIPGESSSDWFFESRDTIQPYGIAFVSEIQENGYTSISSKDLLKSVQASIREYGIDSVPNKHIELWKTNGHNSASSR